MKNEDDEAGGEARFFELRARRPAEDNGGEASRQSRPAEDNGKITFYYSREHRLSRASRTVRELNSQGPQGRPGLIKSLTPTRAHVFMLLSLFLACAMVLIASRVTGASGAAARLGGNSLSMKMRREGERSLLALTKRGPQKGEAYTGPVEIAVSPERKDRAAPGSGPPGVFTTRVFFTFEKEEEYLIELPPGMASDGAFFIMLQGGQERISRRLRGAGE